jgi:hypothetical protein
MYRSLVPVSALVAVFTLAVLVMAPCCSAAIVVPNSLAAVEGNSNNGYPFNLDDFGHSSMRYQQAFAASEFAALGGPTLITGMAFRPDNDGNAFSTALPDIQINLSTTTTAPSALSTTFAANVGSNDTVVYARGPLTLSSANTGAGPRDFDIVITFTTPFLYDPSQGNLLLEVRNFGGGLTTQFDAHNANDAIARVFAENDATAASGIADSVGLVAQFLTDGSQTVPEPSTFIIFSVGGLVIAGQRVARRFLKAI